MVAEFLNTIIRRPLNISTNGRCKLHHFLTIPNNCCAKKMFKTLTMYL